MKLYQYDDVRKLNQALGSFSKNGVPIEKVKLLTVENKVQYFVLVDPKQDYQQPKVESKTEEEVKKNLITKKEDEVKPNEVKPKEGQTEPKVGEKVG